MEENPTKKRNWGSAAVVTLLIVIIPIIGVINDYRGVQYRRETKAQLQNLGKLPNFKFQIAENQFITHDSLQGLLTVVAAVSAKNPQAAETLLNTFKKMDDQFGKIELTRFLILTDSTNWLREVLAKRLSDISNFYIVSIPTEGGQIVQLPTPTSMALVDAKLAIRNFYDMATLDEGKKLARHFQFLMPIKKEPKPEMRKQGEQ
jgi:hypothetical protein